MFLAQYLCVFLDFGYAKNSHSITAMGATNENFFMKK